MVPVHFFGDKVELGVGGVAQADDAEAEGGEGGWREALAEKEAPELLQK